MLCFAALSCIEFCVCVLVCCIWLCSGNVFLFTGNCYVIDELVSLVLC